MSFSGHVGSGLDGFALQGANLIDGFRRLGYATIGSGAVDWFDPSTQTGAVLGQPFEQFYFPGNTWSLGQQLTWIDQQLQKLEDDHPRFVFLNVGETHVPYWHEGAPWSQRPSPCRAFGGDQCDAEESAKRQLACLTWVDAQGNDLGPTIEGDDVKNFKISVSLDAPGMANMTIRNATVAMVYSGVDAGDSSSFMVGVNSTVDTRAVDEDPSATETGWAYVVGDDGNQGSHVGQTVGSISPSTASSATQYLSLIHI